MALLTVESLWISGRALERGIRRFEIRFLTENQNSFFISRPWQDKKKTFALHTCTKQHCCRDVSYERPAFPNLLTLGEKLVLSITGKRHPSENNGCIPVLFHKGSWYIVSSFIFKLWGETEWRILKICEKPTGNIIIVSLKGAIKLAVSIMYQKYWIWKDPIPLS